MLEGHKVVALCCSEIQNENTQSMVYPLYQALSQKGWKCILFNSATDLFRNTAFDRGEASIFQLIHYDFVDAVVLYAADLKNQAMVEDIIAGANAHHKPVFVVDGNGNFSHCIDISFDEQHAFRDLVTHLVEKHHFQKFACIAGFRGNPASESRVETFRDVLEKHQIPFSSKWFGYGDFYAVPTRAVMERFLADPEGLPEAIVCINDSMAIAVCEILNERGIRVPEDVVVTGFDGIVQEKYNYPRLTTCRRDMHKFSLFLADLMETCLEHGQEEGTYAFPYTLDVSESCGCRACSVESMSRAINSIYSRMNDNAQYDRSMNNMLTKLTFERDDKEVAKILRYYTRSDSYLCMNADFYEDDPNTHTYENMPFCDQMIASRFFYGETESGQEHFPTKNLLPEWKSILERDNLVVVYSLHNQQYVYGYWVTFAADFNYAVQRTQRFVMNLDSCISMYVQQNSLRRSNEQLKRIQSKIIVSFADLVESRDGFTGQHVKRTSEYLRVLVHHLALEPKFRDRLSDWTQQLMTIAAPLHDIEKINISDTVLNKPGRLTPEEFEVIKTHTTEGGRIIRQTLTNIESEEYVKMAADMATYHHEKWDGSGYPEHLAGEEIPLCARIMAVVDVFDALTSKRVYKNAFSVDKALQIMRESSGTHFDPDIIPVFLRIRSEVETVLQNNQDAIL